MDSRVVLLPPSLPPSLFAPPSLPPSLPPRYVVERMEPELWAQVLDPENQFRRQLIDQVKGRCQAVPAPNRVDR